MGASSCFAISSVFCSVNSLCHLACRCGRKAFSQYWPSTSEHAPSTHAAVWKRLSCCSILTPYSAGTETWYDANGPSFRTNGVGDRLSMPDWNS